MISRSSGNDSLTILPILTQRQEECLTFLFHYFVQHRFFPTQREIAHALGLKTNSADPYLAPLEKKSYIIREPGQRRNVRLTHSALQKLSMIGILSPDQLSLFEMKERDKDIRG